MSLDISHHASASTKELTLEQKAALSGGADFWSTKAVGAISSVQVSDGPHGLRKQAESDADHLGIGASVPATCFPPAVGLSQTWDPELVQRIGVALGEECQAENVGVLLGPGVNIKRDPRCGRNFEYLSEDPFLAGALGAAWVSGVQSQGVGTSLKHFAANNAEHDRMRSSSDIDPRPLREIYLRPFQRIVQDAQPWTVMCSYNKINGVYAAENHWLLTDVLRQEWGFQGAVMSDWGAVRDRVAAISAGVDLTMPGGDLPGDAAVAAAVTQGQLSAHAVDRAANQIAALDAKTRAGRRPGATYDKTEHHALAREVAGNSIVLLKNDEGILPLQRSSSIAVIGEFARVPRYQGAGSSHVNATRVDVPLEEIKSSAPDAVVSFSQGFTTDGLGDATALREDAVRTAEEAGTAVLFLGLGARQESEGFDREHIEIPQDQLQLLEAVVAVQPRTIVILSHGGVLRLAPVAAKAPAILDGALLGQAAGGAIADVLFGDVNPSGRLAETVPTRLEDTPSFLNFPGENSHVRYGEGLFVGYRWYDARKMPVVFPFGHGLSYTSFAYSELDLVADDTGIKARVTITNTGDRGGREVVQAYVGVPNSPVARAPMELKGFTSVYLQPGESQQVSIHIRRADLAYWDTRGEGWCVENGDYEVAIGASSRDLRVRQMIMVKGDDMRHTLTPNSTIAEVLQNPVAAAVFGAVMAEGLGSSNIPEGEELGIDMARMMNSIPIGRMTTMGGQMTPEQLDQILDAANSAL
ncbi:glycoside hydrolase family 3 C-terminal domain-containing protein [Arthrobacter sp. MDT1-48-3]